MIFVQRFIFSVCWQNTHCNSPNKTLLHLIIFHCALLATVRIIHATCPTNEHQCDS
ncbi:hypothetical protein BMETH_2525_0 [methanotrophic bacterial endosymbiont of Bathymodiolus sp.]|nr:hypothetical protein BMETH_2525_0 [methanotrophic bacterial endosymbiont of Bathymodiolus sp.]